MKHRNRPYGQLGMQLKIFYLYFVRRRLIEGVCFYGRRLDFDYISIRNTMIKMYLLVLYGLWMVRGAFNTSEYELGANIIRNPYFLSPEIPAGVASQVYVGNIDQWACDSECDLSNMNQTCALWSVSCDINFTKGVDLDSNARFNNLSQQFTIQSDGQYYLQVLWLIPFVDPSGKQFKIYLNQTLLSIVYVNDNTYNTHISDYVLNLTVGNSLLTFEQFGSLPNSKGIIIGGVTLQQLTSVAQNGTNNNTGNNNESPSNNSSQVYEQGNIWNQDDIDNYALTQLLNNNLTRQFNKIPGNRIFISLLMNFLFTFDRLHLYYFHHHKLSFYTTVLLSNINALQIDQGNLPQQLFENCEDDSVLCKGLNDVYSSLLEAIEHKHKYSSADFLSKNENGIGFYANHLEYFVYELPSYLLIALCLRLLFQILSKYRISDYLRRYSLLGVLLVVMCEGKIQQFSFYFFMESLNFFSAGLPHKFANVFLLFFFFVIVVFSVGGLIWFKYNYRKLVKYFIEEYRCVSVCLLFLEALEKSIFPLLLGAVHALLLDHLTLQSIILFVIEVVYFGTKLITLRAFNVLFKFKTCVLIVTSLLRMCLIITLYLYHTEGEPDIINCVHFYIVWLYILCWFVETLNEIIIFVAGFVRLMRKEETVDDKLPVQTGKSQRKNGKTQTSSIVQIKEKKLTYEKQMIIYNRPIFIKMIDNQEDSDMNFDPKELLPVKTSRRYKTDRVKRKSRFYTPKIRALWNGKQIDIEDLPYFISKESNEYKRNKTMILQKKAL